MNDPEPGPRPPTALDILAVLDRSNCRECGAPSCLAFAALALQKQRSLDDCPHLDPAVAGRLRDLLSVREQPDWTGREALAELLQRFRDEKPDIAARAAKLGGWMRDERLAFHCLGKMFEVDPDGGLHSDCHQNPWLHVPMLSYVLDSAAREPAGDWVRFEELKGVHAWVRFFEHSCQRPILELALEDPILSQDIWHLFAAEDHVEGFQADASFLLRPLPKVPFVLTYRAPDDEIPASASVFLDHTAAANLDPESLFRLGRGMAEMFRKVAHRHGSGIVPR